jgi:hypothetical protein
MVGGWRKLRNEEIHSWYPLPNIIRMLKSRRMMWAGHAALTMEKRNACRILVGKARRKGTTRKN